MKSIKYIFSRTLTVATLVVAAACDIEEYNPTGATPEDVWTSPEGFVTAVNGAYFEQREWYGKDNALFMFESGTDLWYNQAKATFAAQLSQYSGLSPSAGNPNKAVWESIWRAINICNAGINRIKDAGFANDADRNKREGELRFLRGFYYWIVVEQWGGVMLRTTELITPETTAKRSSVDDFYNLITSDLQFAADNLPNEWGSEYSRATKKSAMGFLAKAYLSWAYYGTGADRDARFAKARDIANDVIARQGEFKVKLWPNYADLWLAANNKLQGKADGEALYVISNSVTDPTLNDNNANRLHMNFQTQYIGKPGLATATFEYGMDSDRRLMPTFFLLNLFKEDMDSRYEASFQETWIATSDFTWNDAAIGTYKKKSSVKNQKLRANIDVALLITKKEVSGESSLPYNVVDIDSMYDKTNNRKIRSGLDFPALKKYRDNTRPTPTTVNGYNDVIVMRLAEMYLISAEAELQLGNKPAAATQLNVLRTRAAIKTPVDKTAAMQITDPSVIDIDFILDERALELAGEHTRWFDLKRTGRLYDRVRTLNPDIGSNIQTYHVLRPIRIEELNALTNGADFGQNFGYN
jgi:starch-binding outer membrane protein, SusD/RagB family